MASSFTTNKNIEKPGHNDYVDDWDVPVNANMDVIDSCLGDVTTINLTALSSYTLTFNDVQASTIKFTGTLNNATVPIRLTVGISGAFTIINATTAAGVLSALSMAWSSGGTAFVVGQGQTRDLYADGGASVWAPRAPTAQVTNSNISLTGLASDFYPITQQQASGGMVTFTGTLGNYLVGFYPPDGFLGTLFVRTTYGNAGGSSTFAMFSPGGGGGGAVITTNKALLMGFSSGDAWLMATGTQP